MMSDFEMIMIVLTIFLIVFAAQKNNRKVPTTCAVNP